MVPILSRALVGLLHHLGLYACLFSLHSLGRGRATAAYRQGSDQIDITCQGLWTSDPFWQYITSSCPATSPRAEGLTCVIHATSTGISATAPTSSSS